MFSRHVRGPTSILAFIVLGVNSDSKRSLHDESIFSESLAPLDLSTPSTNQPAISPLDHVALPSLFDTAGGLSNTDPSDLLFWDGSEEENEASSSLNPSLFSDDDILLADSPQPVADCSTTSEFFLSPSTDPLVGKSRRLRRLDQASTNSQLCPLPSTADPPSNAPNNDGFPTDLPGLAQLRMLPNWNTRVQESTKNKNHNKICSVYFTGAFPWGVCSSGDGYDVEFLDGYLMHLALFGTLRLYKISHGTLGEFTFSFIFPLLSKMMGKASQKKTKKRKFDKRVYYIAPSMLYFCPDFTTNLFCCQQITAEAIDWQGPIEGEPCIMFR